MQSMRAHNIKVIGLQLYTHTLFSISASGPEKLILFAIGLYKCSHGSCFQKEYFAHACNHFRWWLAG